MGVAARSLGSEGVETKRIFSSIDFMGADWNKNEYRCVGRMNLLSHADRSTIEACVFDGNCLPAYEWVRGCLIWPDERPDSVLGLHGFGYELLGDLWTVRGLIHRGVPIEQWGAFGGEEYLATWNECLFGGLHWIGFRRIALTIAQRTYLETQLDIDTD